MPALFHCVVVEREGEGLDDAGRGVDVPVAEVALDVLELGGGDVVDQVEVAGHQVGVGGVVVGVDLEVHAAVLRLVRARVAVPLAQGHLRALGVRVDGVRAVADGLLQPGVVVREEGLGQRREGRVAEGVGEGGELLVELDGEGLGAGDLQPGEGVGGLLAAVVRVGLVVARRCSRRSTRSSGCSSGWRRSSRRPRRTWR